MSKQDLIKKNPLRALNPEIEGSADVKRLGLVMARAGLGKTAILVQIAMDSILRGNKVIHVSIGNSLAKTKAWYDDIFNNIVADREFSKGAEYYNEIMRNRMIMTFNESTFSRERLQERLTDLIEQDIFKPNCLLIDGFDFKSSESQVLIDIKKMVKSMNLTIWFSCVCHREDTRVSEMGIPAPCHEMEDLFDTAILLKPNKESDDLGINIIKDLNGNTGSEKLLSLDPATLLLK
jgi:hypothetical protein